MLHDIGRYLAGPGSRRTGLRRLGAALAVTLVLVAASCTEDGNGGEEASGGDGGDAVATGGLSEFDDLVAAGSADEACAALPIEVVHGLAGFDTLVLTARQSTEGVVCSYSDPESFDVGYGWIYNLDRTPAQQLELDLPLAGDPTPESLPDFGEDAYLINFVTLDFWAAVAPLATSTVITNAADKDQAVELLTAVIAELS